MSSAERSARRKQTLAATATYKPVESAAHAKGLGRQMKARKGFNPLEGMTTKEVQALMDDGTAESVVTTRLQEHYGENIPENSNPLKVIDRDFSKTDWSTTKAQRKAAAEAESIANSATVTVVDTARQGTGNNGNHSSKKSRQAQDVERELDALSTYFVDMEEIELFLTARDRDIADYDIPACIAAFKELDDSSLDEDSILAVFDAHHLISTSA